MAKKGTRRFLEWFLWRFLEVEVKSRRSILRLKRTSILFGGTAGHENGVCARDCETWRNRREERFCRFQIVMGDLARL